ncbi:radical SAM protein [Phaeocystidibacter luteus]|uniref:Radical SAM protein n=1 Tax=Phaeocystidibacter luteus TaxID=911197 RepID=A0A6N6RCM9_9FLAO|nr:radical SAM/SPASM domain-containing protein [Phaeocystidibacter luteus]KAB2805345.1 radical SAM protein [Phaeocystidibacter luteus]
MSALNKEKLKEKFNEHPVLWPALKKGQEVQSRLKYRYFYKWPGHSKRASIREINLEFASACNLRCKFCALDHNKPKQNMSLLVLRRFLDQWLVDFRFHHVEKINLYNGGETLLHPKRIEMLRIIKEYRQIALKHDLKFPKISMLTNGMLLRPTLADTILNEELVDEIGFSLDGGTPEEFEDLRVNAKWAPFYKNVGHLATRIREEKLPVRLYGITIVPEPKPLTKAWMHPEFQQLSMLFDHHELRRLHDWGGEIELDDKPKAQKSRGCDLLLRQLVLLPNGDVTVCCNDLNSKGVVGNLWEKSLWEIYNSAERRKYLEFIDSGRKDELELCKDCMSF